MENEFTIKSSWENYERIVLPRDAHPIQRQETRRAFYAGAYGMLCMCHAIGHPDITEEQGVSILDSLGRESKGFRDEVSEGTA